jgi:hypothetical protein
MASVRLPTQAKLRPIDQAFIKAATATATGFNELGVSIFTRPSMRWLESAMWVKVKRLELVVRKFAVAFCVSSEMWMHGHEVLGVTVSV